MFAYVFSRCLRLAVCATVLLLTGCATVPGDGNPQDPAEGFNRAMYTLNESLDAALLKPVAKGYDAVLPNVVKTGISNFFANLEDVWIAANNLLQGKPGNALSDVGRFLVNSTLGLGGLIDWASSWGLEKHNEDFGQTLGRWGVSPGPYVMLPVFGPRTARDTVGLAADVYTDPVRQIHDEPARYGFMATRLLQNRVNLFPADKVIEDAALDKYSYIRDAYLQRRRSLVYDGDPPREKEDSE